MICRQENGAEFHCNSPVDWTRLPQPLQTDNVCHLLCDRILIDVVQCKEGVWTGNPDLGFWCHQPKEQNDETGPSPFVFE